MFRRNDGHITLWKWSCLERLEVQEAPELTPWSQGMQQSSEILHPSPWLRAQAGVGYRDHGRTRQCQWLYVPAHKQVHPGSWWISIYFLKTAVQVLLLKQRCGSIPLQVRPFHQQDGMLRTRTSLGPAGKCTLTVRRSSMGSSSRHSTFGLKRKTLAIGKEWSKTDSTGNCWDPFSEFFRPKHWYVRFNKYHQNQKVPVQLNPPDPPLPHESLANPIVVVANGWASTNYHNMGISKNNKTQND